ncbi:DNA-3-methyladenine glycosylase, partial [Roseisolibacter sp. H3M3-2]|uniref:DNA-3-methyladenine glycosylase n=1 Tax=Roseisolibacter sp. H3M3-2 TaxID=3031323 RepID=UPI0023DB9969
VSRPPARGRPGGRARGGAPEVPSFVAARGAPDAEAAGALPYPPPGTPFPPGWYDRDPRLVARALLGAVLECRTPQGIASGRIVETEAYLGPHDPACHAVAGRTARTWHLHGPPGVAYVYRIYGMHWCVNAVTLPEGVGSAVLLRALEPIDGVALMRARRPNVVRDRDLANGPGKLCTALGIDGRLDGVPLDGSARDAAGNDAGALTLRAGAPVPDDAVVATPRIGITRAADWPLRYLLAGSAHVSRTPPAFPRVPYSSRDGDRL